MSTSKHTRTFPIEGRYSTSSNKERKKFDDFKNSKQSKIEEDITFEQVFKQIESWCERRSNQRYVGKYIGTCINTMQKSE